MINQCPFPIIYVILSCFFLIFSIEDIIFQKINNFIVLAGLIVNLILYLYFKTQSQEMLNFGSVFQKLLWMTIFIYVYNHGLIGSGDLKMILYLLTVPFFFQESRIFLLIFSCIVLVFFLIGRITHQKKNIKLAPIMFVSIILTIAL